MNRQILLYKRPATHMNQLGTRAILTHMRRVIWLIHMKLPLKLSSEREGKP